VNVNHNTGVNAIPTQSIQPDPPYGILKNGKKPLFSIYNKTLKKPKGFTSSSNVPNLVVDNANTSSVSVHTDQFFERQQKLNQLKQQMAAVNNNLPNSILNSSTIKPGKTLKKMKQLKTTTKRFIHLGKKNGRVGVLIKNQKTRKKILKDTHTLKKRPLSKIKHYLRKHNLIKIGSTAPEHIIRSIYENSFLSGDVYNKNVDTLLHNYLDN
jgi:ribosomal protein L17